MMSKLYKLILMIFLVENETIKSYFTIQIINNLRGLDMMTCMSFFIYIPHRQHHHDHKISRI